MFEKENASGIIDFDTLIFFVSITLIVFAIYKLTKGGSKKTWSIIILLSLCATFYSRFDFEVEEMVIINEGYKGKITILFNESCGENIEFDEKGKRLFHIPENGILIVKESNQTRLNHSTYYYKSIENLLIEIPQMGKIEEERGWWQNNDSLDDPDRKKVGIYFRSINKNMQSAFVCTYNELTDMIQKSQKSISVDSILLDCRGEK